MKLILPTIAFIASIGLANSEDLALQSVYRISSSISGTCATAFQLSPGNLLVTNFHVADSMCQKGVCKAVRLERAQSIGAVPGDGHEFTLKVRHLFPALDVAILDVDNLNGQGLVRGTSQLALDSPVTMIGFPSCGPLTKSTGTIIERGSVTLRTTARGASGSSGSPILNATGEVVGIASESDSFVDALIDKASQKSFELRAARGDITWELETLSPENALTRQAELLLGFYRNEVITSKGIDRIRKSVTFINSTSRIRSLIIHSVPDAEIQLAASLLDQRPRTFIDSAIAPPATKAGKLIEQLTFAANIESRGFDSAPSTEEILQSGRDAEQAQSLIALLKPTIDEKYPGMVKLGAVTAVPLIALGLFLLAFYGWTLGIVFAKARGNFFRRFAKMCLVGILLWPVSFLVWILIRLRSA